MWQATRGLLNTQPAVGELFHDRCLEPVARYLERIALWGGCHPALEVDECGWTDRRHPRHSSGHGNDGRREWRRPQQDIWASHLDCPEVIFIISQSMPPRTSVALRRADYHASNIVFASSYWRSAFLSNSIRRSKGFQYKSAICKFHTETHASCRP